MVYKLYNLTSEEIVVVEGEKVKLDQIGIWSEIRLEIIKKYASAYASIMSKQSWCQGYVYIYAFAGAGKHISRQTV